MANSDGVRAVLKRAQDMLDAFLPAELQARATQAGLDTPASPAQVRICIDEQVWPRGNATPDIALSSSQMQSTYKDGQNQQSAAVHVHATITISARAVQALAEETMAEHYYLYVESVGRVLQYKLPGGAGVRTCGEWTYISNGVAPVFVEGQQAPKYFIAAARVTLVARCSFPAAIQADL